MENKREKIIELIAKMSNLTSEDSGAFQGEISTASSKIQELMNKYSIEWMEVNQWKASEQDKELEKVFTSKASDFRHGSIKEWNWRLARIIARVTNTKHYAQGKQMVFFGVSENAEVASTLYVLWLANIQAMSAQATRENIKMLVKKYGLRPKFREWLREEYPDEDPKYFGTSWIAGCIKAISENVYEQEKKQESSTALVLYKKAVEMAYADMSKHFRKVNHSNGSRGFSTSGYSSGQQAGSNIHIGSKGIGAGAKKLTG